MYISHELQELMRATPASLKVDLLTVDSCQGSEFDYVVLSTVRANSHGNIGFVQNRQRINVAISRSLYGLIALAHTHTHMHTHMHTHSHTHTHTHRHT